MTGAVIQVGLTSKPVPGSFTGLLNGMRLLQRAGDAGRVYYGFDSSVTTGTGIRLSKGEPETSIAKTIPADHFLKNNGAVWLIADTASQNVDWEAD